MERGLIKLLASLLVLIGFVSCERWMTPPPESNRVLYILVEDSDGNNLLEGDFDPSDIRIGYSETGEFIRFDSESYSEQAVVDTLGLRLLSFLPSPSLEAKETVFLKIGEYDMDVIRCTETGETGFVMDKVWFNDELVYDSGNFSSLQDMTGLPAFRIIK